MENCKQVLLEFHQSNPDSIQVCCSNPYQVVDKCQVSGDDVHDKLEPLDDDGKHLDNEAVDPVEEPDVQSIPMINPQKRATEVLTVTTVAQVEMD